MASTIDPLLISSVPVMRTARPSRGTGAKPSALQFKRRRRAVGAVAIFGLSSILLSTGAFASNPAPADQALPRTVIAHSGDTLWDIARDLVPRGSIADLVAELVRLNGSRIEAGQVIRIP